MGIFYADTLKQDMRHPRDMLLGEVGVIVQGSEYPNRVVLRTTEETLVDLQDGDVLDVHMLNDDYLIRILDEGTMLQVRKTRIRKGGE